MTVLDANLLLYAQDSGSAYHSAARDWVQATLSGQEWVGIPWVTIWAFLRIGTNPRLFRSPLAAEDAVRIIRGWTDRPNVAVLQPGPRHEEILCRLVIQDSAIGNLVSDAVLAAIAIEHGAALATTDRDFARFEGLKWFNPLTDPKFGHG